MEKFFLKSKTIIGALVMVLPTLLPLFGVTLHEGDTALISQTGDTLLTLFGLVVTIYGRVKAEGNITLAPG